MMLKTDKRNVYLRKRYTKERATILATSKRWRDRNKFNIKSIRLKTRYGMTLTKRQEMEENQKGKCKICERVVNRLYVDHCHKTGMVRGLLCFKCNSGLGNFDDSKYYLSSAIKYLGPITKI